jgi:uncharacterized protein YjiS (DUF1127 family)
MGSSNAYRRMPGSPPRGYDAAWQVVSEMPIIAAEIRRALSRASLTIRAAWRNRRLRRGRERDLAALVAMDDGMLRDMGISRCEVRAAIRERANLRPR